MRFFDSNQIKGHLFQAKIEKNKNNLNEKQNLLLMYHILYIDSDYS